MKLVELLIAASFGGIAMISKRQLDKSRSRYFHQKLEGFRIDY